MSIMPMGPMQIAPPTEQMRELTADADEKRALSVSNPGIRQREWGLAARTDPTVTFEEYIFWAKIEREMEAEEKRARNNAVRSQGLVGSIKGYFTSNEYEHTIAHVASNQVDKIPNTTEAAADGTVSPIAPSETHVYDAEWRQAARALRTAGWLNMFYLITTDILGWGQTPAAFSAVGYGKGVGIFVLMGAAAMAAGIMLWRVYIKLDSSRFPMLSFGDPFLRLYGQNFRRFINVFQSLQQFLTVAVIILGNAGIISQLADAKICYIVTLLITMIIGLASGFLRSLKHLGWICNFAVWLNIISFIIIMVAAAKYFPDSTIPVQLGVLNKDWIDNPAPVATFFNTPPPEYQQISQDLFVAQFSGGINGMVYAFSGTLLFIAFMSEMRQPMDFWKASICAQVFILVVYIVFGAQVYSNYGQYSYSTITQVVNPLSLQIVSNVLGLITALLAIFLYFNIGMKTVYLEVFQEIFNFPPITTKKGKYLWYALGPLYWILAFIVAASIPQFGAFTSFVGGLFGINFTYTFAAILFLSLVVHEGAALPGEGFDAQTGITTRHDGGIKRLARGFLKSWYWSIPALLYTCLGLAASGMGTWAAVEGLIAAFGPGGSITTSWGCTAPGG